MQGLRELASKPAVVQLDLFPDIPKTKSDFIRQEMTQEDDRETTFETEQAIGFKIVDRRRQGLGESVSKPVEPSQAPKDQLSFNFEHTDPVQLDLPLETPRVTSDLSKEKAEESAFEIERTIGFKIVDRRRTGPRGIGLKSRQTTLQAHSQRASSSA